MDQTQTIQKKSVWYKIVGVINLIICLITAGLWLISLPVLLFATMWSSFNSPSSVSDILFILLWLFGPPVLCTILTISVIGLFKKRNWAKKVELYLVLPMLTLSLISFCIFISRSGGSVSKDCQIDTANGEERILSSSEKDSCYNLTAQIRKDKSICDYISSKDLKNKCLADLTK